MTAPRPGRRGFTLFEVAVAVVLVAIILVVVHTALSSGLRTYRRSRDVSERDNMAWAATWLLGQDLQRLSLQTAVTTPTLIGTRDRSVQSHPMLRLRVEPRVAPGAEAMRIDYFFMPETPRGGALVRRSAPLRPEDGVGDDGAVRHEVIAAGLSGIALRYFDGQSWSDRWDPSARATSPVLVELTLEFARPGRSPHVYRRVLPVVVQRPLLAPAGGEGGP